MKRASIVLLVVVFCIALGTGAYAAEEYAVEAESLIISTPSTVAVNDNASASGGRELVYTDVGSTYLDEKLGDRIVEVRAQVEATRGLGGDNFELQSRKQNPDGTWTSAVSHGTRRATTHGYSQISWNVDLDANVDYRLIFASTTKHDVYIDRITLVTEPPPPPNDKPYLVEHEAETFTLNPSSAGMVLNNPNASGGQELYVWSNATASKTVAHGRVEKITVRARGMLCGSEPPRVEVRVDGVVVGAVGVSSTSYASYTISANVAPGTHQLALDYTNDLRTSTCDRNVLVDRVALEGAASQGGGGTLPPLPPPFDNPLAGFSFYVDPYSNAARQAALWRESRPADAAQMDKIAAQPRAFWTGDDTPTQVQNYVNNIVTTAASQGKVPLLVTYNIPSRDCGSYSAGGAGGADEYKAWIQGFANGIGSRKAIVIVEPDAIPAMDCLSATDRQLYLQLVGYAVDTLRANPQTYVYVDAGHSAWVPAQTMVDRLRAAGVTRAHGFSLNVSNFQPDSNLISYGEQISAGLGGTHFVIDSSRNGLGVTFDSHSGGCPWWLNPPGRALGKRPTTETGHPLVDAYLWVKYPGESDGNCGPYPPSGTWMPEYALGLAQRVAY